MLSYRPGRPQSGSHFDQLTREDLNGSFLCSLREGFHGRLQPAVVRNEPCPRPPALSAEPPEDDYRAARQQGANSRLHTQHPPAVARPSVTRPGPGGWFPSQILGVELRLGADFVCGRARVFAFRAWMMEAARLRRPVRDVPTYVVARGSMPNSSLSSQTVNGPSLTSSTSIFAPKTPRLTGTPRTASRSQKMS